MEQLSAASRRRFGFLFLVLAALCYGIAPFPVNYLADMGMDTLSFLTFRAWVGVPAIFVIYRRLVPKGRVIPEKKDVPIIILVSVLASVLTTFLLFYSFRFVNAGVGETMHYSYPALVVFGCFLFRGDKLKKTDVICAFLGLAGIVTFYIPAFSGSLSLTGISLALASGFAYAAFIVISSGERMKNISDIQLVFYMFAVSVVIFSLIEIFSGNMHYPVSQKGWIVLALTVCMEISGMLFFQLGLNRIGAAPASLLSLLEPLTTVILGILFFHEKPTIFTVIGSIVVFASVLLSVMPSKEKKE